MSDARPRGFASDNSAGVHPNVLAAIAAVNDGHTLAYGHDPYSQEIERRVAAQFGERAQAFFVFNGSAANVLSLRAMCRLLVSVRKSFKLAASLRLRQLLIFLLARIMSSVPAMNSASAKSP